MLKRTLKSFAIMILRLSGVNIAYDTPFEVSVIVHEKLIVFVTERISMMPLL
jgi:hypothetical protein